MRPVIVAENFAEIFFGRFSEVWDKANLVWGNGWPPKKGIGQ
jgi:hypothetical protein